MAEEKFITYRQAFNGMLVLGGLLITLVGAVWAHEMDQNTRIEKNHNKIEASNNTFEELKDLLELQNQVTTDTRERVIRIEERIKE